MEEINKRREELKVTEKEWFSVWMLGKVKKRKRMEAFQYQALREVVKEGGDNVMKNFGAKYKEIKIEGSRKRVAETLYMGMESDARKRFQGSNYG